MTGPVLSVSWYRVAQLHPRLRDHVRVHIHRYQGKIWYVLQDDLTNQSHRLGASAYFFVSTMDGTRTLDALWADASTRLGDTAPTQDEILALLAKLHAAEMLQTEVPPDARELLTRFETKEQRRIKQVLLNPTSIKMPLWDPDAFIARTLPLVRWAFTWWGGLLWLLVVGRALVLAGQHWTDLTANAFDRLLAFENLALLSVAFVFIKLIHELGHAYAIKAFGGEVHELGLMLLIFFPSPYVDASSSSGFRDKWQRMLVGASGMLIELFVAALALGVWLWVAPGMPRAIAFNVMMVTSISTIVFNGNPLLRYDGYYILADLIEIPNLAARANAYWGYLCDRHLFKVEGLESPAANRKEHVWLFVYAPLSFVYRIYVTINIALAVASQYLFIGVLIGLWSLFGGIVMPMWRLVKTLVSSAKYRRDRPRVIGTALAATAAVAICFGLLPFPLHTNAEGVVWLPDSAIVRAGSEGFVTRQLHTAGESIASGTELVDSEDPRLTASMAVSQARIDELRTKLTLDRQSNRVEERLTGIELEKAESELSRQQQRLDGLRAFSATDGTLSVARPQELIGGFHKQGEILAFVAPPSSRIVRATVDQADIGLVRTRLSAVDVMLSGDTRRSYRAAVLREVPGGLGELPSRALGDQGGGSVVTDPSDPTRTKTPSRQFQFDLRLPLDAPTTALGSRVYVRFEHRWEPLGWQIFRRARQLLLSRLNE